MKWISVKDHRPITERRVLFTDGKAVCSGRYFEYQDNIEKGYFEIEETNIRANINLNKITYWMYLPAPPVKD